MQSLISAAAYVTVAIVGIRFLGIRRMLKWADRPISAVDAENNVAECAEYAEKLVIAVARVGRRIPGGSCLPQSLALTRMLRGRGMAAETKIGVKTADGFHAHAWVEVGGVPLTRESGHRALTHTTTASAERPSL